MSSVIFIIVADESESELGLLDLIQGMCFFVVFSLVLVDILEESFDDLREYDLIYNIDKVDSMFDEVIMGGMVLETNVDKIMATINAKNSLEFKNEDSTGRLPTVNKYSSLLQTFIIILKYNTKITLVLQMLQEVFQWCNGDSQ